MPIVEKYDAPAANPFEKKDRAQRLLDGPPSDNYNIRQLQLIAEKFVLANDGVTLTDDIMDEEGMKWADSEYSKAFNKIYTHVGFNTHPRILGKISNITLNDVEYYINHKELPEK